MFKVGTLVYGIEKEQGVYDYTKIFKARVLENRFHLMNIEILECPDEEMIGTKLIVFSEKFAEA